MTILDAMREPRLFGRWFGSSTWDAWRVGVAALFGLPLPEGGLELFKECTGRETPPTRQVSEAWFCVGRRGGKSLTMALIATYCAVYRTYKLKPGERGTVMLLASDRAQAGVLFRYISALFEHVPGLKDRVRSSTKETIELTNGLAIEIHTSSYRAVRGRTVVVAICDEIAFWLDENSANPDVEILHAIRPAMVTIDNSLLLVISSAHARRGELWRVYQRYWGQDSDNVLVWKAPTWVMNPELPQDHPDIAQAFEDDAAVAAAEYGSVFRSDCERPLSTEALKAVRVPDRRELARAAGVTYSGFVDASGGSSDSMTLAITHKARNRVVLDLTREARAPFVPDMVVEDFAKVLRAYGVRMVRADRYAAEWPKMAFRKWNVDYRASDLTKSDLYSEFIPMVNSQRIELLDDPRLHKQLETLERRATRGGRDVIDHPRGGKDDLANAAAGAAYYAEHAPREAFGTMDAPWLFL